MIKDINIDWNSNIGHWYRRKEVRDFLHTPYVKKLLRYILHESYTSTIYPSRQFIFKSLLTCPPDKLRVVILGSEPYNNGSATGLPFANDEVIRLSCELETIQECIERTVYDGFELDFDPTLESWTNQGVMLFSTALTVRKGMPNSHKDPWRQFTQFFIKYIALNFPGTIFLLWGAAAQRYKIIDDVNIEDYCHVLEAEHPSFYAFGGKPWDCDHFNKVNEIIKGQNGVSHSIVW